LVFEVGDDLLDDGVLAVLGLDEGALVGAVGEEAVVAPVGEQLGLRSEQPGAPDDQPAAGVGGLGDLGLAAGGVVDGCQSCSPIAVTVCLIFLMFRTPIEYSQPLASSSSKTFVFQNPESARSSLGPLAPARSTRAISSSQKRLMPFCVLAEPFRRRMCSASLVSARVARIGW